MKRRWIVPVLFFAIVALLAPLASAEDKAPDATLRLSEGSVAAGIGWNWGKGTLSYMGKTYHFKVSGVTVAEVGITRAEASGSVYNLKSVDDFNGVYAAAGSRGNRWARAPESRRCGTPRAS